MAVDSNSNIIAVSSGTQKEYMFYNNLYEPNYSSKYYAALFTSINRFLIADMTLNINLIGNLIDYSSILSTGITYMDLNDFSLSLNIYSYLGKKNTEYTLLDNASAAQLILSVVF